MDSTTEFDWSKPRRQSPAALFIILIQTAANMVKTFWPLLLYLVFQQKAKDEGENIGTLIVVIFISSVTLVVAALKFWFYKFHLSDGHLHVQSGWWSRKQLAIPVKNIQSVNLEQNLWQQILGVVKVSIDSAGSNKTETTINALPIAQAESLKTMLSPSGHPKGSATDAVQKPEAVFRYRLGLPDLLKLSLTANHLETLAIITGLSIRLLDELRKIPFMQTEQVVSTYAKEALKQDVYFVLSVAALLALVSVVVSALLVWIRYFDFSLVEKGSGWFISMGLFTRKQQLIPVSKIQILSYYTSWIRRPIDFWTLSVRSVGESNPQNKGTQLIPLTSASVLHHLTARYLPHHPVQEQGVGISKAYRSRNQLLAGFPMLLLLPATAYWWSNEALWILPALLPGAYLMAFFWQKQRKFRWMTNEDGIWIYSGIWGHRFSVLKWVKIQQVHLSQSPYQRRRQLASVSFITAGGNLSIPYLNLATAQNLCNFALLKVETSQENWL